MRDGNVSDASADRAREAYEAGRAALETGDLEGAVVHRELSIAESPHFKALERDPHNRKAKTVAEATEAAYRLWSGEED
jgi:hypothetical protein